MALPYRLAALWGGQAGSLLLWILMRVALRRRAVYGAAPTNARSLPWVCAVLLGERGLLPGAARLRLEPVREAAAAARAVGRRRASTRCSSIPVMMIHPLVLYLGLTGFSVPFAFALAALVTGQLGDDLDARDAALDALGRGCFLSIGILLGGRWAYEVLGWGGYWAWDPVENASFMPWLAATAYLHSVMIQEKRDMLKIWNLVLIGLTYALCLFGTFLTRSGLVQSVHAFAQTEIFGVLFLGYVAFAFVAFTAALLYRVAALRSPNKLESVVSREASFVLNNWLFMAILAVVFWGTLFPKFSEPFTKAARCCSGPRCSTSYLACVRAAPAVPHRRRAADRLAPRDAGEPAPPVRRAGAAGVGRRRRAGRVARRRGIGSPRCDLGHRRLRRDHDRQEYWRAIRARMRGGESPLEALATLFRKNQQPLRRLRRAPRRRVLLDRDRRARRSTRRTPREPGARRLGRDPRLQARVPDGARAAGAALRRRGRAHRAVEARRAAGDADAREAHVLARAAAAPRSRRSTRRFGEDLYVILTAIEPDGSATLKVSCNPLVNWIWIGGYTFVLGTLARDVAASAGELQREAARCSGHACYGSLLALGARAQDESPPDVPAGDARIEGRVLQGDEIARYRASRSSSTRSRPTVRRACAARRAMRRARSRSRASRIPRASRTWSERVTRGSPCPGGRVSFEPGKKRATADIRVADLTSDLSRLRVREQTLRLYREADGLRIEETFALELPGDEIAYVAGSRAQSAARRACARRCRRARAISACRSA